MKAAIFGAGFAGEVHVNALRSCGVEPAVIITRHEESARAFAEKWGIAKWGTDRELALADDIDAVHICTPPATHGELSKYFLQHGKNILCEKPLCFDSEEAAELAAIAEETAKICALTFNVRYHLACQKAKELIASGEFGRPLLIHGNYMQEFNAFPAPLDWRYDADLAGDMRAVTEIGSHWLDIAQYISGEKVEAVSALFGCFNPQRVLKDGMMYPLHAGIDGEKFAVPSEDAAVVNIKYSNGAIGSVVLSEISPGRGNRLTLEITCEYGNLWWNEEDNNILHTAKKGEGIKTEVFAFGNSFGETFITLLKEFYAAVEKSKKSDSYPSFKEGADICAICSAIYESAKDDSRWVKIKEAK